MQVDKKAEDAEAGGSGALNTDAVMKSWLQMQIHVNVMIDSTKGDKKTSDEAAKGKKQELERKEGLMRMNMMGKRVNFACRYVVVTLYVCVCVYDKGKSRSWRGRRGLCV